MYDIDDKLAIGRVHRQPKLLPLGSILLRFSARLFEGKNHVVYVWIKGNFAELCRLK